MTDIEKNQEQKSTAPEEGKKNPEASEEYAHDEHHHDRIEKIWDSTKQAWTTATFKAGQYKRIVQKKIDLSSIHKKIESAHGDLGKLIDELREQGKKNLLATNEVKELLQQLDSLKATAAALEEELENIREAAPEQTEP